MPEDKVPAKFWVAGPLHPIEFSYLCEYPYPTPGVYAVYLNKQTKLPERIHLPTLENFQFDYNRVFERVKSVAEHRYKSILEQMKKEVANG